MVQYVIETGRAGEALYRFLLSRRVALLDEVRGVRLDFRNDKKADALCVVIANAPELPIDAAILEVRALLSARILVFLTNVASVEAEMRYVRRRPSDAEIVRIVFKRYLKGARLPRKWNKLPYEPPPMTPPQELGVDMGELS